jgi:AcrR family transcriptional regulator
MHDIREDFARALATLLKKETLEHITVKDIAESCNVTRQTFYYHFPDIYALIEWIFLQEASAALASNRDIDTWQEGY